MLKNKNKKRMLEIHGNMSCAKQSVMTDIRNMPKMCGKSIKCCEPFSSSLLHWERINQNSCSLSSNLKQKIKYVFKTNTNNDRISQFKTADGNCINVNVSTFSGKVASLALLQFT